MTMTTNYSNTSTPSNPTDTNWDNDKVYPE